MAEIVKSPEPEWTEVESANVHSVRYDENTQKLYVKFQNGATYSYDQVGKELYTGLIYADSVGSFLARNIKPYFSYELVTL